MISDITPDLKFFNLGDQVVYDPIGLLTTKRFWFGCCHELFLLYAIGLRG